MLVKSQNASKLFSGIDTTAFASIMVALVFIELAAGAMSYNPHHGSSADLPKVLHPASMPGALRDDAMLVSITRDQLAIRALVIRGLAVTLVPELLADPFRDLALRPIADSEVARDVFAVLPPGALHPLLPDTLAALDAVATDLTRKRPGDPRRSTGSRNNEAGPADPRARPRSARPPDAQQR